MPSSAPNHPSLKEFRRLLEMRVRLDVASAIREEPDLDGPAAVKAYEVLTDREHMDRLVRDLAYEETQAAVQRGEVPAAALLLLAGFSPNHTTWA